MSRELTPSQEIREAKYTATPTNLCCGGNWTVDFQICLLTTRRGDHVNDQTWCSPHMQPEWQYPQACGTILLPFKVNHVATTNLNIITVLHFHPLLPSFLCSLCETPSWRWFKGGEMKITMVTKETLSCSLLTPAVIPRESPLSLRLQIKCWRLWEDLLHCPPGSN